MWIVWQQKLCYFKTTGLAAGLESASRDETQEDPNHRNLQLHDVFQNPPFPTVHKLGQESLEDLIVVEQKPLEQPVEQALLLQDLVAPRDADVVCRPGDVRRATPRKHDEA